MVRAVDFNRIHAESEMRRAALLDEMQKAALAAGQATAAPAGDWLWVKLMDFCKKRGFAPANFSDLFEIVDAARAARAPADSVLEDAARESEYLRGYRQGYEQRDAEVRGALV